MTEEELLKIINRKKGTFSKKIVILVILMNILFTLAIMYLFLRTGNEPMTLVGAWFGFTTVELWSLSKIKRAEVKGENNG